MMRVKLTAAVFVLGAGLFAFADTKPVEEKAARVDTFGDPLPEGAITRLGTLRWRHGNPILFVSYSSDGKQIITACQDGTIRVLDADSGKELRKFGKGAAQPAGKPGPGFVPVGVVALSCATLSPDGQKLAVGNQDATITLWDLATGKEAIVIKSNPPMVASSLVFAPDGKSVVARSFDTFLRQYDLSEGKEIRKFGEAPNPQKPINFFFTPNSVAFSADGKTLMTAAFSFENGNNQINGMVKSWEVESGKEQPVIKGPSIQGGFHTVSLAPDGKSSAWAHYTGIVHIWDTAAGKELRQINAGGGYALVLNYSRDGKQIALRTADQLVRLWDLAEGKELQKFENKSGQAEAFGGEMLRRKGFYMPPSSMAFTPDGSRLAAGTDATTIRQWDLKTGKEIAGLAAGHHGAVLATALSGDGKTVVTRSSFTAHLWQAGTGKETSRLSLPIDTYLSSLSPTGQTLAVGCTDGTIRIYDVAAGKEATHWKAVTEGMQGMATLALSPDGKTVATRSYDMTLHIWDVASGKQLRLLADAGTANNGDIKMVALDRAYPVNPMPMNLVFSPDGTLLAGMAASNPNGAAPVGRGVQNGTLRLWDVSTGKQIRQFERPRNNAGIAVFAFSPDGRTIATADYGTTITLWEAASGKERSQIGVKPAAEKKEAAQAPGIMPFMNPTYTCLAFSPDGSVLGAGLVDGGVRFWNPMTGAERGQFKGHTGQVTSLAFAGDGKHLVSGAYDATALVWDAPVEGEKPPAVQIEAKQAELLWEDLADGDAAKAFQAVRMLSQVPRQSVPLLKDRVQAIKPPDAKLIEQLVADLDSNAFVKRKKAEEELEKLGELAEDALRKALEAKPGLEVQKRLEGLLAKLVTGAPLPAQQLRTVRALEVLEAAGTPEAKEVLKTVAAGAAGARVTKDARAALDRLGQR